MNAPRHDDNPLAELHFALAEADAQHPPTGLRETVLDAALAARTAGRPVDEPSPISPVEGFRRAVASFDRLLGTLDDEEWNRPALRDLDVQRLVGHLTGVERDFLTGMFDPDGVQIQSDHIASTDPIAAAQIGRSPAETYDQWRAATDATIDALAGVDTSARLDQPASLHGLHMSLGHLLVARTFELWTHEEDVRRATRRPLQAPDTASLRLMTELAITLLPVAMSRADRPVGDRSARIVLTGPGGGTWQTALGTAFGAEPADSRPEGPVSVRIVVDAVEFCRLVANRADPEALAAVVTGDTSLASDLFAGLTTLALD